MLRFQIGAKPLTTELVESEELLADPEILPSDGAEPLQIGRRTYYIRRANRRERPREALRVFLPTSGDATPYVATGLATVRLSEDANLAEVIANIENLGLEIVRRLGRGVVVGPANADPDEALVLIPALKNLPGVARVEPQMVTMKFNR